MWLGALLAMHSTDDAAPHDAAPTTRLPMISGQLPHRASWGESSNENTMRLWRLTEQLHDQGHSHEAEATGCLPAGELLALISPAVVAEICAWED